MKLIDKDALSMELMNEVLNAYAKADFRFAHALNVFQGLIDKAPTVEERKHGHWEDIDLDTSVCSVCKKPQEYETKYCPECGAKMENNGDDDVTIRQNALQCIYELTNKILDMQVKDKYLNPIVVDINQK